MLYVKEMFDQLEDLLEEYLPEQTNNVNLTWEMKRHYLNMGQHAMWPRIYRVAEGEITLLDDAIEYPFPATLADGRFVYVLVKTTVAGAYFGVVPDDWYRIRPAPDGPVLRLGGVPTGDLVGGTVRITSTMPLAPIVAADITAAVLEEYTGPDYSIEGAALYAMNRITSRGLHSRLDYGRGSVNYQNRSAVPNELMASSIFWLDEFERRVDQWQLVHPKSDF